MEGAGKLIEDDELRAAMAGKGLGTPATRAAVIEGLIDESYLAREGKELHPTAKAFQLLRALRGFGVDALDLPELTGEWEYKLAQMERGKLKRDAFMREIEEMTRDTVERIRKGAEKGEVPGDYVTLKPPARAAGRWSRRTIAASPAPSASSRSASIRAAASSRWPRSRRCCARSRSAR
jgi:DNA topoisomerase III